MSFSLFVTNLTQHNLTSA